MDDVGTTGTGRSETAGEILDNEVTTPTVATGREWVTRLTGVGRLGLIKDPIENSR